MADYSNPRIAADHSSPALLLATFSICPCNVPSASSKLKLAEVAKALKALKKLQTAKEELIGKIKKLHA